MPEARIPSIRISPDNATVLANLGLLRDLAGTWEGRGFNLVARPDFENNANLFLELNLTKETLRFEPISTSIPNRGVAQNDIELFGLTYLQQISDEVTGGALHIEPGIWVTQPATTAPPESAPCGAQIVTRMGSIPHGNAMLAQGTAATFSGPPTLSTPGKPPAGSIFPSFNSTPFPVTPQVIRAAGTSETSAPAGGFTEYNLANAAAAGNPRTPLGNTPPVLPAEITQALVNDPIGFLQQKVAAQVADGHEFEGTVINIATTTPISFLTTTDSSATGPTVSVSPLDAAGGIENIPFLETNAETALVYATFWIEKVTHPHHRPFLQLQYAQMVLLNFPAILIPGKPNFSWPHVSVATLHKTFG
jgi:hypothetical protein